MGKRGKVSKKSAMSSDEMVKAITGEKCARAVSVSLLLSVVFSVLLAVATSIILAYLVLHIDEFGVLLAVLSTVPFYLTSLLTVVFVIYSLRGPKITRTRLRNIALIFAAVHVAAGVSIVIFRTPLKEYHTSFLDNVDDNQTLSEVQGSFKCCGLKDEHVPHRDAGYNGTFADLPDTCCFGKCTQDTLYVSCTERVDDVVEILHYTMMSILVSMGACSGFRALSIVVS